MRDNVPLLCTWPSSLASVRRLEPCDGSGRIQPHKCRVTSYVEIDSSQLELTTENNYVVRFGAWPPNKLASYEDVLAARQSTSASAASTSASDRGVETIEINDNGVQGCLYRRIVNPSSACMLWLHVRLPCRRTFLAHL